MEWNDLRIFLAIARERSLGAAARKLGQTQPTMGRRLRALETAVGQTLLQRTPEGFVLTDEGMSVLRHAERVEEEALAFERKLAGNQQELEGVLRVTSSDWFGAHVLTPVFGEFARLHPKVTIELLTDSRVYSLSRREADIAFRITPFDEPDVVSRRLLRTDYALYIRQGSAHPRMGDGRGTSLITMDSAFGGMPDNTWLKQVLPNATVGFRSNNRDVQAQMCAQGAGLAVLPTSLADGMPQLERVDIGEEPPGRVTWVGYHRDLRRVSRLRALLALVLARLSRTSP